MFDVSLAVLPNRSIRAAANVVEIVPYADSRWERYIRNHPDALVYHHPAWLRIIERAYGHRPAALAYEDTDGTIRGVLPLCLTRGAITGRRLSSLPHTPVCGPLADDPAITAALLQTAVDRAQRRPGTQVQVKAPSATLDNLVPGLDGTPWDEAYVLELPDNPEKLRVGSSRNHSRIRWSANKATRLGLRIRAAERLADLQAWYPLYLETMRWHFVPPRPFRFFQAAWEQLQPDRILRLLLAEQHTNGQQRLVAGSVFLAFGQTFVYAFNGRRRSELSLRPNDLIQWAAIQQACREGFRFYDFGEVNGDNHGLAEFKMKWGALPRRLYRYHFPALDRVPRDMSGTAGRLGSIVKAAWRHVPLWSTARVGELMYRYA